jgi:hypothetical protein
MERFRNMRVVESDSVVCLSCLLRWMQMFALLAALKAGERHADLRDSRTFETLYAVTENTTVFSENMVLGFAHADLRDENIEFL